jgi:hypothetical protein
MITRDVTAPLGIKTREMGGEGGGGREEKGGKGVKHYRSDGHFFVSLVLYIKSVHDDDKTIETNHRIERFH